MKKYKQLVFDQDFNIKDDIDISYYKSFSEMKKKYKDYVYSVINDYSIPFWGINDNFYCPRCLSVIEKDSCSKCSIKYDTNKYWTTNNYEFSNNDLASSNILIFDVIYDEVIAYILEVEFDILKNSLLYRDPKIELVHALLIKKDGLYDFINNSFYSFKMFDDFNDDEEMELLDDINHSKVFYFFEHNIDFVYLDNFDELKNSPLFKYSCLDVIKKELEKNFNFPRYQLLCYPIYYKSFEYLIKMGLYDLAFWTPYEVKNGKSFYESFGVPKKYYNFMKENNISFRTLNAMRIYPTDDKELLKFIESFNNVFGYSNFKELVDKYIDVPKIYKYFNDNNLSQNNIYDYWDYINFAEKLKLDLNDSSVLYPNDLMTEHDKLYEQILITNDKNIDNNIKNISKAININVYEDDKYIIFPASDINSLVDESNQMSNCVKTYCDKISKGECQIYFMRYKNNREKSLITIEVRNNKVVQARSRFNKDINEEEKKVIKKFEKSLFPITIE